MTADAKLVVKLREAAAQCIRLEAQSPSNAAVFAGSAVFTLVKEIDARGLKVSR